MPVDAFGRYNHAFGRYNHAFVSSHCSYSISRLSFAAGGKYLLLLTNEKFPFLQENGCSAAAVQA